MTALSYHVGPRIQRGRGIGALFSGLARALLPAARLGMRAVKNVMASPVTKSIANTAKNSAVNMAADLIEGSSFEEAAEKNLTNAKANIAQSLRNSTRKRKPQKTNIDNSYLSDRPRRKRRKKNPRKQFNLFH